MLKTQHVTILVEKDMTTKLPVECYSHEIPLYEEAHPEGTVKLLKKGEEVELDTREAYEELLNKFGGHPETGQPLADVVYGRNGHQLENGNFILNKDVPVYSEAPQSEKEESISLDDLREILTKLEVDIKPAMNRPTLMKLLEDKTDAMATKLEDAGLYVPSDPLAMKAILDAIELDDEAA